MRFAALRGGQKWRVELYQAEWCPHSHRVRERLTELGLDVALRQVAAEPDEREEMRSKTGTNEIPVLVTDVGDAIHGEDDIVAWLEERFDEREDAGHHRAKAQLEVPEFAEIKARL